MENMKFGFMNDDEDVLMRMQNDDGTELTFLSAPPSAFEDEDDLGPIVTGFDKQIVVAFNQEKIERLIDESIEKNGEIYGVQHSALLPISLIVRKGMEAAEEYLRKNSESI